MHSIDAGFFIMCLHRSALMETFCSAWIIAYVSWFRVLWNWSIGYDCGISLWKAIRFTTNAESKLLSMVLAALVLKENITILKCIGVIVIIAGVVLIAGGDEE